MSESNKNEQEKIDFYFLSKGKEKTYDIFINPLNLPTENIIKAGYEEPVFKFSFDNDKNELYIQDIKWREKINSGEDATHNILNRVVKYIRNKYKKNNKEQIKKKYGDPDNTSSIRKMSDYEDAWTKINEFFNNQLESAPINIPVIEINSPNDVLDVTFCINGFSLGNISINEPVFSVNRYNLRNKDHTINYDLINELLLDRYIKNIKDICPKMYENYQNSLKNTLQPNDIYFIALNKTIPTIYKLTKDQTNTIHGEESLRSTLRTMRCMDCNSVENYPSSVCKKCNGTNLRHGKSYDGNLILFSYNKALKQVLIYNNSFLDIDEEKEILIQRIKEYFISKYKIFENEITVCYDPSVYTPFITTIKKYKILRELLRTICSNQNIDFKDIFILEAPIKINNGITAIILNQNDENIKTNFNNQTMDDYKISHGIDIPFPYILVDSRIKDEGLRIKSIIESYKNYAKKHSIELNTKLSKETVIEEMVYHLVFNLSDKDIINIFSDFNDFYSKYECYLLLKESKNKYNSIIKTKNLLTKTASSNLPVGLDWWGLNSDKKPIIDPIDLNIKSGNSKSIETDVSIEVKMSDLHDKEFKSMKPLEVLLQESRV